MESRVYRDPSRVGVKVSRLSGPRRVPSFDTVFVLGLPGGRCCCSKVFCIAFWKRGPASWEVVLGFVFPPEIWRDGQSPSFFEDKSIPPCFHCLVATVATSRR